MKPAHTMLIKEPPVMRRYDTACFFSAAGLGLGFPNIGGNTNKAFCIPHLNIGYCQKNYTLEFAVIAGFGKAPALPLEKDDNNSDNYYSSNFLETKLNGMLHFRLSRHFHLGLGVGGTAFIEYGDYEDYRSEFDQPYDSTTDVIPVGTPYGYSLMLHLGEMWKLENSGLGFDQTVEFVFVPKRKYECSYKRISDEASTANLSTSFYLDINKHNRIYLSVGTQAPDFDVQLGIGYIFYYSFHK